MNALLVRLLGGLNAFLAWVWFLLCGGAVVLFVVQPGVSEKLPFAVGVLGVGIGVLVAVVGGAFLFGLTAAIVRLVALAERQVRALERIAGVGKDGVAQSPRAFGDAPARARAERSPAERFRHGAGDSGPRAGGAKSAPPSMRTC